MTIATQLADERHDPHCLDQTTQAQLLGAAPWRRLAVLGDSIAAGVGDPVPGYVDLSWADRLARVLPTAERPTTYLNLGVRELRAAEIRQQQLARALAFGPDLAVVTAGGNDMLRRSFDSAHVEEDLDAIVGALASTGCLVVTFGLFDLSRTSFIPDGMRADLHARIRVLNGTTRRVTARHGGVCVDFFDHPALDDCLLSADMTHPNRRGHACIATSVVQALAQRVALTGLAYGVDHLGSTP